MMHKCIVVKWGKPKNVNSAKNVNLAEIGGMCTFCGNRGEIYKFSLHREEYAIFIIGVGGWTPLARNIYIIYKCVNYYLQTLADRRSLVELQCIRQMR